MVSMPPNRHPLPARPAGREDFVYGHCLAQHTRPASRRAVSGRRHTREDAIRAIVRCHDEIGAWPTQSDYLQWRRILRHTGRLYGSGEPRLPDTKALRRLFSSWRAPETQHSNEWTMTSTRPDLSYPFQTRHSGDRQPASSTVACLTDIPSTPRRDRVGHGCARKLTLSAE